MHLFEELLGNTLTTVAFTQNTLTLEFSNSAALMFNVWPVVAINTKERRHSFPGYYDKISSLLSKQISEIHCIANEKLQLKFGMRAAIILDLNKLDQSFAFKELISFRDSLLKYHRFNGLPIVTAHLLLKAPAKRTRYIN